MCGYLGVFDPELVYYALRTYQFHALCKIHDRAFNCLAPIGLGENNLSKYTNSLGRQDWTIQRLIQRMSIKKKQLDRGVDEQ